MLHTRHYEMKDSGVDWIGDAPKEWDIVPFSRLVSHIRTGLNPRDNFTLTKDDSYYYVTIQNFKNGRLFLDEKCDRISESAWHIIQERSQLEVGDILFASISKDAQAYLIRKKNDNWNINESVFSIRVNPDWLQPSYFYYQLINSSFYSSLLVDATGSTFQSIKQNNLRRSYLVCPPLPEQSAIASFLDEKCGAIDSLISEAKATIEEYKAWKASVIFEAVTKGLDPNAEMKDSGVEWIGDVPKAWNVYKTLYCLDMPITDGPHTTPDLFDDGIPFVSAEAVSCGNGRIDFSHIRGYISDAFYQECCKKYIPQIDDIYMIKSGATTGRVAIVDVDVPFTIWSPLAVFRANKKRTSPRFLFYFLQSAGYQKQIELEWSFGTQQNIGMRVLEQLKVCMPSLEEQETIVTYLDMQCSAIDGIIAEKQSLIEELETYKKSLIYETVTGKRRVC